MRLKDRVAVVTGAAGGLGRAIANRFIEEGAALSLVDRIDVTEWGDSPVLRREDVMTSTAELTDSAAVMAVMAETVARFGRIDVLVNLAGVGSHGASEQVTEAEWRRVLDCNLTSVFLCCQAVLPGMKAQRYGRIVNIGSVIAKNGGNPRPWIDRGEQARSSNLAYGVSKAGIHALTLFLAKESAVDGITVNVVAPGPVASNPRLANFPQSLKDLIPVGRLGQPEDVADAVAFLAGDQAGFITGEILDVNGGVWMD